MQDFDLLKLYIPEEDLGPRSHISCTGGHKFYLIINKIIQEIIQKDKKVYSLAKRISHKVDSHPDTVLKMLRQRNKTISLAIIKELLNEWKIKCNKTNKELIKKKKEINLHIKWLACGSSYRTEMKAVKKITNDFAKIIGAHHADGNLHKEHSKKGTNYQFTLIDYHKSNLLAFRRLFLRVFKQKLKIKRARSNAWEIRLKNKIFGRYLEIFLNYPSGKKYEYTIPKIIQRSNKKIRKSFVIGFLTFDGSVETDRKVSCGVKNKVLRDDICKVLPIYLKKKDYKNCHFFTTNTLKKKELDYWKTFFEENTEKWFKLHEFSNGFSKKVNSKEIAYKILDITFPKQRINSTSFSELIKYLSFKQSIKRQDLANHFNIANSSMYKYVYILKNCNIIKENKIARSYFLEFNANINQWVLPNRPWFNF